MISCFFFFCFRIYGCFIKCNGNDFGSINYTVFCCFSSSSSSSSDAAADVAFS